MARFDIYRAAERLMSMDDEAWVRHANPWSVYTRFTCLPLIVLAIYARVWIGWWCLIPLALALLWTWANPRVFRPPASLDNWASKGVMGERVFLNRHKVPVDARFGRVARFTAIASFLGLVMLVIGLWRLNLPMTIGGTLGTIIPKVWFVNDMVRLYKTTDARDHVPNS